MQSTRMDSNFFNDIVIRKIRALAPTPQQGEKAPDPVNLREVLNLQCISDEYRPVAYLYGKEPGSRIEGCLIATIYQSHTTPWQYTATLTDDDVNPTVITADTPAESIKHAVQAANSILANKIWPKLLQDLSTIHNIAAASSEFNARQLPQD